MSSGAIAKRIVAVLSPVRVAFVSKCDRHILHCRLKLAIIHQAFTVSGRGIRQARLDRTNARIAERHLALRLLYFLMTNRLLVTIFVPEAEA
jgi:hypothetical protein